MKPTARPPAITAQGSTATQVLHVAEDPVGVGVLQVAAEPLCAVGGLLGVAGRGVLALFAQLLRHRTCVARDGGHPLAGLRRALVHLIASLLLGLARLLLDLLLLACAWAMSNPPPKLA